MTCPWRILFAAGLVLAATTAASSHPLSPVLLELRELGAGEVELRFKTSLLRRPGFDVRPVLPASCTALAPPEIERQAATATARTRLRCAPGGLEGERIGIEGLERARIDALVRVELVDGRSVQRVLRAGDPWLVVPARESRLEVVRSFLRMGVSHLLTGLDHLLFVFGLLLLVAGPRALLATITAFTLGHSVTLSLAVLGLARLPSGPVELAIAASVFLLAVELSRDDRSSSTWMRRFPWVGAFAFGLLHGLGFAGALSEVGLPQREIPLALLAFNVGIELGQVAFVGALLVLARALGAFAARVPAWSRLAPVYGMGSVSAFWCLQRAAVLLP